MSFTALYHGGMSKIIEDMSIVFLKIQLSFLFKNTFQAEAFNGGIETNCHGGTFQGAFSDPCL